MSLCCTLPNDAVSKTTTLSFPQVLYLCVMVPPCGSTAALTPTTMPRRSEVRSIRTCIRLCYQHQQMISISGPWSHWGAIEYCRYGRRGPDVKQWFVVFHMIYKQRYFCIPPKSCRHFVEDGAWHHHHAL